MKHFALYLVLACATTVFVGCTTTTTQATPRPATTVTDNKLAFELPDLDGNLVSSDDEQFKDKVVVVDIWGSWCPPCRAAIPYLVRFYEVYHDQGLEIVGLSFERGSDHESSINALADFAEEYNIDYTILYGGSTSDVRKQLSTVENFSGYPTTILIGRDGKVSEVEVGFSPQGAPNLERAIQALLGIQSDLVSEAMIEEKEDV